MSPERVGRSALLIALALLGSACTPLDNAMHAVFGRSMRDQVSFDPYENPLMPAAGSVPFASGNYPAESGQVNLGQAEGLAVEVPPITAVDMARGGEAANALVNPVAPDAQSLARGKQMYDRMCAICHGPVGNPAEAPILPKFGAMVAFPLSGGASATRSDGYIYGMIVAGRGIMPAYGHQVTHYDRWHIVNYVRQLQGRVAAPAAGAPAEAAPSGTPGER